jgi:hypothetical protein
MRLDPKKIELVEPIKALGTFMVPVTVFPGVKAEIKTMIVEAQATEEELARMQAEAEQAEAAAIAAVEAEEAAQAASTAEAAPVPSDAPADQ